MSELTIKQQIEELKVKDFFIAALLDATDISQLEAALDALDDIRIMNLAA